MLGSCPVQRNSSCILQRNTYHVPCPVSRVLSWTEYCAILRRDIVPILDGASDLVSRRLQRHEQIQIYSADMLNNYSVEALLLCPNWFC